MLMLVLLSRESPGRNLTRGVEPGVVCIGIHIAGADTTDETNGHSEATTIKLPFDRERIRQFTCIMALNMLRTRLLNQPERTQPEWTQPDAHRS